MSNGIEIDAFADMHCSRPAALLSPPHKRKRALQFLRASPETAATLTRIAFAAKRHWGYPEQWIESWKESLTIQSAFIAEHETNTAFRDRDPVGFYALKPGLNRMRLEHLWVLPEAMHRGVGRALFEHAIGRVRASGFTILEIESDPHAAGFYERMGARQVGAHITEVEGRPRELPVFVYEIDGRSAPTLRESQAVGLLGTEVTRLLCECR